MEKNKDCPCKNVNCPRNGQCEACREHHDGNPFCEREQAAEKADE